MRKILKEWAKSEADELTIESSIRLIDECQMKEQLFKG
jgi:hypothetical protein